MKENITSMIDAYAGRLYVIGMYSNYTLCVNDVINGLVKNYDEYCEMWEEYESGK
jgi:hypothetical protein